MGTPWDARTYDRSSQPQQEWAADVLARLDGVARDATILDVGCGTGRVTELLLALVPNGRVLAMDASQAMVTLARERLGDRADVWCQDALEIELAAPVDVVVSTAALHWSPTTTGCGHGSRTRCGQMVCSKSSAGDTATSIASAGSSTRSREIELLSWSAGRRGTSQRPRTPNVACTRPGSPRSAVGSKSARPFRRTSPRSCRHRSSPPTSHDYPPSNASHLPPPSSPRSPSRSTTFASTSPPSEPGPDAHPPRTQHSTHENTAVAARGMLSLTRALPFAYAGSAPPQHGCLMPADRD